ncbi:MAG: phosphohistidine phosphatase SixA [Anaerolineae bacterium]|nr:phosphohistidine phosphatase SixA [Anaerolineae bacterium]
MQLYFLRHGEAEDYSADDYNRALTPTGRNRLQIAAKTIHQLSLKLDHIYTSPRIRAHQTAQIVGTELGIEPTVTELLNYGFNQVALAELINPYADDARLMLVGHEPTLSSVIAHITGGRVDMKRGGLARVDVPKSYLMSGALVWLIAPRVFDNLGD